MHNQPFGVAINGVPFDPGTAECYGQSRGSRPSPDCEWREEAIFQGYGKLGLDQSNAHVQPNGAYHYHSVPTGLISQLEGDTVQIGYAADGFKIYVSKSGKYKPSYVLKRGTRSSGPGGAYDGTYTQDFLYKAGSGQLDECNGMEYSGQYAYFATQEFPYIPRCWKGTPDSSFTKRGPGPGASEDFRPPPPRDGRRPPPRRHRN